MTVRVTVWNEFRQEHTDEPVRAIYPDGIHAAIAVPSLDRLDLSGASQADGSGLTGTEFQLTLSGASSALLHGSVERLVVDASGASQLHGDHLPCQSVAINASGASTLEVHATAEAEVEASGGSVVTVGGSPAVRNVNSSGGSSVTFP